MPPRRAAQDASRLRASAERGWRSWKIPSSSVSSAGTGPPFLTLPPAAGSAPSTRSSVSSAGRTDLFGSPATRVVCSVGTEMGQIIVADVNAPRIAEVLADDRVMLGKLIGEEA